MTLPDDSGESWGCGHSEEHSVILTIYPSLSSLFWILPEDPNSSFILSRIVSPFPWSPDTS